LSLPTFSVARVEKELFDLVLMPEPVLLFVQPLILTQPRPWTLSEFGRTSERLQRGRFVLA
jgi:hypothetical protein